MVWDRAVRDGSTPSSTRFGCTCAKTVRRMHVRAVALACTPQRERQHPPLSAGSPHIGSHAMSEHFDFVIVGGGSAGAVIASRLSEDPSCRVALIEAGDRPPAVSSMPIACAAMQRDPATDWMYTADPGKAGLGLNGRRIPVPRGKMLGGSSSINYMMYVRGHPGDYDSWAAGGAAGWSYAEVLPYFRKSEGLAASEDIPIDM